MPSRNVTVCGVPFEATAVAASRANAPDKATSMMPRSRPKPVILPSTVTFLQVVHNGKQSGSILLKAAPMPIPEVVYAIDSPFGIGYGAREGSATATCAGQLRRCCCRQALNFNQLVYLSLAGVNSATLRVDAVMA